MKAFPAFCIMFKSSQIIALEDTLSVHQGQVLNALVLILTYDISFGII